MSADDAAREQARQRFRGPRMFVGTCEDREAVAFVEGAAWQRELAAREIEAEMRRHDNAQVGFSAVGDAYAHTARIALGKADR